MSFYRDVHKGIRAMMGSLVERAGRVDFGDPASVAQLRTETVHAFALLESHAHHEDRVLVPLLRAHAPAIAARNESEHHDHEGQLRELLSLLVAEERAAAPGWTRGHAFCVALSRFAGELNEHMADEEELAMPALWAALDDGALAAAHHAIVSAIEPPHMMAFLRWMLPAMRHADRVAMLTGMRADAPPPAFAAVLDVARATLASDEHDALLSALALPRAA